MKIEIPVSVGELLDKVAILWIKTRKIKNSTQLQNVEKEYDALLDIVLTQVSEDFPLWEKWIQELVGINTILWEVEDKIRNKESIKQFDKEFILLARKVYLTNDKRSEIKKKINIQTNSYLSEEKSYTQYQ